MKKGLYPAYKGQKKQGYDVHCPISSFPKMKKVCNPNQFVNENLSAEDIVSKSNEQILTSRPFCNKSSRVTILIRIFIPSNVIKRIGENYRGTIFSHFENTRSSSWLARGAVRIRFAPNSQLY